MTHDIDTSPEAVGRLIISFEEFCLNEGIRLECVSEERETLRALSAALTESRAETASAYEAAARVFDDGNSVTGAAIGRCIRALATPDQTAALDRLIADAVGPHAEALAWYETQFCEGFCEDMPDRSVTNAGMENDCSGCKARAILAASKKGGV